MTTVYMLPLYIRIFSIKFNLPPLYCLSWSQIIINKIERFFFLLFGTKYPNQKILRQLLDNNSYYNETWKLKKPKFNYFSKKGYTSLTCLRLWDCPPIECWFHAFLWHLLQKQPLGGSKVNLDQLSLLSFWGWSNEY